MRHEASHFDDQDRFSALEPVAASDAADYIEKMCSELSVISSRTGLKFLHYLLEVAREEAGSCARGEDIGVPIRHQ